MAQRKREADPAPVPNRRDRERRERLVTLCKSLPQAACAPAGQRHLAFTVRGKTFAYYLFHHHDDGVVALCAKAPRGRQQELVKRDPQRYLVPAYLGPHGWVSLRLDLPAIRWDDVFELFVGAYRLQAPRSLAADID